MNFISYNSAQPGLTASFASELNSIGCEAWIDVGRFSTGEKLLPAVAVELRASQGSLTKSFADLRRKFRRDSAQDRE